MFARLVGRLSGGYIYENKVPYSPNFTSPCPRAPRLLHLSQIQFRHTACIERKFASRRDLCTYVWQLTQLRLGEDEWFGVSAGAYGCENVISNSLNFVLRLPVINF
jgi:hypothetical protein